MRPRCAFGTGRAFRMGTFQRVRDASGGGCFGGPKRLFRVRRVAELPRAARGRNWMERYVGGGGEIRTPIRTKSSSNAIF